MNEITDTRFPNPLVCADFGKTTDGGDRKILLKDFIYIDPIWDKIEVPHGFIFDGASIPRFAWSLLGLYPFSSEVVRAGLIHDFLYRKQFLTRHEADDVLRRILIYEGILSPAKIAIIYNAVRVAGGPFYDQYQQESDYLRPDEVKKFI